MLMLPRVEWLRCELTCDQVVLLPFSFLGEGGKGERTSFFLSPFPEKKPDRGLGVNGLKKKRWGRGIDRSLY